MLTVSITSPLSNWLFQSCLPNLYGTACLSSLILPGSLCMALCSSSLYTLIFSPWTSPKTALSFLVSWLPHNIGKTLDEDLGCSRSSEKASTESQCPQNDATFYSPLISCLLYRPESLRSYWNLKSLFMSTPSFSMWDDAKICDLSLFPVLDRRL